MNDAADRPSDWDTEQTHVLLRTFVRAWQACLVDYADRRLNSEHSLQAALYHHLRGGLPADWRVFPEAAVQLGENSREATGKARVVVDLLIECQERVIGAIELKFTPRGTPSRESMRKDLTSLAHITSRRALADRATLDFPRFRKDGDEGLQLRVLPQRKLIFAAIVAASNPDFKRQNFWDRARPLTGYWAERPSQPPNMGVALGQAATDGTIAAEFYGPPFERIGLQTPEPSTSGLAVASGNEAD